mgnify:FL=1
MEPKLVSALKFAFEQLVSSEHYRHAFELGLYLLSQNELNENDLKQLMICAMRSNNRKRLLTTLQNKEKKSSLGLLEIGLVASLFYQLKDTKGCIDYALKYSREKIITIDRRGDKLKVLALQTYASGAFNFNPRSKGFHMPEGHNNLMTLFERDIKKIVLRVDDIERALDKIKREQIHFDVIYNSITDPDRCAQALHNALILCEAFPNVAVINHPKAVLATTRDNNYRRFHRSRHIIYPKNIKLESVTSNCYAHIADAITNHKLTFPIIVRLSGYQGGKNMHLIDAIDSHDFADFDAVVAQGAKDIYLIEYIDVSFTDKRLPDTKLYPKFRAFLAGGKLYPIHLFTAANDFNVHLANSESLMQANSWLVEKEKDFCKNPEGVIGKEYWKALEKLLRQSGLDYVGIDFAVSDEQSRKGVVVFEVNAAMRNWMKSDRAPMHVRKAWEKVTRRMHHVLCERAQVPAWKFHLPVE